jgi:hypothetical protein
MGKGMAARADFNPADYALVAYFYKGDSKVVAATYREDHARLEALFGQEVWVSGLLDGGCASCGTPFAHGAVVIGPDGYFSVGQICGAEYFGIESVYALRTKEAKRAEERAGVKARAAEFLDANPGLAEALTTEHHISQDLRRKLERYGDLSVGQVALAFKLEREAKERAEAKAETKASEPPAVPVVEGKYTIEGRVLSYRWQESHFGYNAGAWKMLVLVTTDDGTYKLWGTIPSKIVGSVQRGTLVRFNATVEKSDKDESFGFYSRPTKAEVIEGGKE